MIPVPKRGKGTLHPCGRPCNRAPVRLSKAKDTGGPGVESQTTCTLQLQCHVLGLVVHNPRALKHEAEHGVPCCLPQRDMPLECAALDAICRARQQHV